MIGYLGMKFKIYKTSEYKGLDENIEKKEAREINTLAELQKLAEIENYDLVINFSKMWIEIYDEYRE